MISNFRFQNVFAKSIITAAVLMSGLTSCSSAYFAALEKIGIEKRDLMVSRVKSAKDSQIEAKEQFKNALEQYRSIISVKGGSLEEKYEKLNEVLEESEAKSIEVTSRISKVEDVTEALFDEWDDELNQYSNKSLKRDSEQKLAVARTHYKKMINSMKRAESKLEPALRPLRDNVLYLKHNLNAKAIYALDAELGNIEIKVEELIRDLSKAIDEADSYISTIENQ